MNIGYIWQRKNNYPKGNYRKSDMEKLINIQQDKYKGETIK